MGPILFILYINDIISTSKLLNFYIFADDTTLLNVNKNLNDLINTTNKELETIDDWLAANKLSLNLSKTKFLFFSPRGKHNKKQNLNPDIFIRNTPIKQVSHSDFLGLTLDDNLDWAEHINKVKLKISRILGILYKIRHKLNKSSLLSVYYALIQSRLTYCLKLWGSADKTKINPLQVIQNRFVRLLHNKHKQTHAPPLFKQSKILNVSDLYKLDVIKFVWCCINRPSNFPKLLFNDDFKFNTDVHTHFTRQRTDIHPPKIRTNFGKRSLNNQGRICWNDLSAKIKSSKSISNLKTNFIFHCHNNEYI